MRMTVDDLLSRSACERPDKEAVVHESCSITYKQLDAMASRLANLLKSRGVKSQDRVAVIFGNSALFVISFFAISRAGAVLVPLSPAYTDRELAAILNDAEVSFALCGSDHATRLSDMHVQIPVLAEVLQLNRLEDLESLTGGQKDICDAPGLNWNATHAILFTSGTTGRAKGAVLSHRSRIMNTLSGQVGYATNAATRANVPAPMFHSGGMILGLINVIAAGGTLLLPDNGSVEAQCHALEDLGANLLLTVPTMIYRMVESKAFLAKASQRKFALIHGASPIPAPVVERLLHDYPHCQPFHGYGSTEACQLTVLGPEEYRQFPSRTGRALPGIDVRVVDENGRDVAIGEIGEVVTSGPHVFDGYLNDPAQTAAAIHDGLHWTGDLASIDERGLITIVGRRKDMIISGGFNVYAREVEDIVHTHPAVQEAAVFGVPDREWGEIVAAAVILKPDCHLNADSLASHCRAGLAAYKVPRRIWFVETMPRTPVGKVQKFDLARQLLA